MPRKKTDVPAEAVQAEEKPAKKTAKKALAAVKRERVDEVYLQTGGAEWNISDCKERAVAAYVAEGHRASSIKKLVIYLKPEEGKAYFVVNDGMNGCLEL